MAAICPNCGSHDVQNSIGDRAQCVNCGATLNSKGEAVSRGPDETTRAVMEARLQPRTDNLVGNLADIQRFGAAKAPDDKAPEFAVPPGVDLNRVPTADSPPVTASEVQAEMSRTDITPAEETMDSHKQAQAAASKQEAADLKTPKK